MTPHEGLCLWTALRAPRARHPPLVNPGSAADMNMIVQTAGTRKSLQNMNFSIYGFFCTAPVNLNFDVIEIVMFPAKREKIHLESRMPEPTKGLRYFVAEVW